MLPAINDPYRPSECINSLKLVMFAYLKLLAIGVRNHRFLLSFQ